MMLNMVDSIRCSHGEDGEREDHGYKGDSLVRWYFSISLQYALVLLTLLR